MTKPTNFPFIKDTVSYRQEQTVSPYSLPGQLYDTPIGKHVHTAYVWRVVFYFSISISFLLSLILIYLFNTLPVHIVVEQVTSKGFLKSPPALLEYNYDLTPSIFIDFMNKTILSDEKNKYIKFMSDEVKSEIQKYTKIYHLGRNTKLTNVKVDDMTFKGQLISSENKHILNVTAVIKRIDLNKPQDIYINPFGLYINKINIQGL